MLSNNMGKMEQEKLKTFSKKFGLEEFPLVSQQEILLAIFKKQNLSLKTKFHEQLDENGKENYGMFMYKLLETKTDITKIDTLTYEFYKKELGDEKIEEIINDEIASIQKTIKSIIKKARGDIFKAEDKILDAFSVAPRRIKTAYERERDKAKEAVLEDASDIVTDNLPDNFLYAELGGLFFNVAINPTPRNVEELKSKFKKKFPALLVKILSNKIADVIFILAVLLIVYILKKGGYISNMPAWLKSDIPAWLKKVLAW